MAVLVRDFGPINVYAESIFSLDGDVISLITKFRLNEQFHRDRLVEARFGDAPLKILGPT
ncbi:hypothetical protein [Methylocystis rosea]|uniref:Uncharacterized protein n=1 Tax=Methylocystis rosea TaxID=173366 RepID=A0A3G8M9X4_9HYPH|nr:hypothetical protein [Methylocystis rosea]AZG78783.1 hypothetical protein EHO51_18260 [Methylocystis rosea]